MLLLTSKSSHSSPKGRMGQLQKYVCVFLAPSGCPSFTAVPTMCDYLTQSVVSSTHSSQERPHPLTFVEDMNPDVVRSCGESVGIASLLRDVCHLEVSDSGFVRSPVSSSRCGSGSSEAPSTLNSARAASSAREEPPHFFDAAAAAVTCSPLAATPKRAQKLKALKQWLTLNRLLSRSSSTVCCVDYSAAIGHHCSGRPATATHRSSRRQRRHSGPVVVPMCTTAQKQQQRQHSSSSSSTSCSRTRECSPTSSTSSTCTLSPQQQQHSNNTYERQQQLHRQMLPHDALIERHSGFSNLDDWFAEINIPSSNSNNDSSSTCEDSDIDADEDSDECCRSRRMQTDDPSFYRC
jgi:hypothetical protein